MSDQKIREFRERAQTAVTAPDADLLLYRGRALRRRRRLAPVVAVAVCAVIGIGFLAYGGGDARTGQQPIDQPTVTETPDPHPPFLGGAEPLGSGTYALDLIDADGLPEATVELSGCCWRAFREVPTSQRPWGPSAGASSSTRTPSSTGADQSYARPPGGGQSPNCRASQAR